MTFRMDLPRTLQARPSRLLIGLILIGLGLAGTAQAAILELTGPSGATVFVNGRARGFFPLEHPLDVGPGEHVVECQLDGHKNYRWVVRLVDETDWQHLHVRMTPLSKKTAVLSNVLWAGLGQHYTEKPVRGWLYGLAEAGGLLAAVVGETSRSNERKDYLILLDKYNSAINPEEIAYFKAKSDETYQSMLDNESMRDTGLLVAGGAVVLSILDSLLFFPSFEAGPGSGVVRPGDLDHTSRFGTTGNLVDELTTVHAGIKLTF
jgi:hypothetical protein